MCICVCVWVGWRLCLEVVMGKGSLVDLYDSQTLTG